MLKSARAYILGVKYMINANTIIKHLFSTSIKQVHNHISQKHLNLDKDLDIDMTV